MQNASTLDKQKNSDCINLVYLVFLKNLHTQSYG